MLNSFSTKTKLMLLPALFFFIVVVSGLVFNHYNSIVQTRTHAASQTDIFIQQVLKGRITVYQFLRTPSQTNANKVDNAFDTLEKSVNKLKPSLSSQKNVELSEEIIELSQQYVTYFNEFAALREKELNEGIQEESKEVKMIIGKMVSTGLELEKNLSLINQSAIELKNEAANQLTTTLFVIAVLAIIVFVLFSIVFSNIIVNTLDRFQEGLLSFFRFLNKEEKEAHLIHIKSNDEFGAMADMVNSNINKIQNGLLKDKEAVNEALNVVEKAVKGHLDVRLHKEANNPQLKALADALNSMLHGVKGNVDSISIVLKEFSEYKFVNKVNTNGLEGDMLELINNVNFLTSEISDLLKTSLVIGLTLDDASDKLIYNVDVLNQSSNEAAASLEETAAALEEITSTIVNNSENVMKMSNYAKELNGSATKGQELAQSTTTAMDEITEQVTLINESISVIDQIAFQTNILSLNAAVEAATAGEAGKGFAVVAQEVRNLAARSAEAAKEIKDLVENATQKASHGKSISGDMIQGYKGLLENITKSTHMIEEIASASKEQEAGITQINDAVTQLDQQTQKNASIASQTHDIAVQTDTIAKEIVADANSKEFLGKSEAKIKEVENPNHPKQAEEKKANKEVKKTRPKVASNHDDAVWESF